MKVIDCKQGSVEWLQARCGILTASEMGQLLTDKMEVRTGKMPLSYVAAKLSEAWTGEWDADFGSWEMTQGDILESEALPWLELERNVKVERVGFITTDDGLTGCSPDGLIGETGVEVKCPQRKQHCKTLLAGTIPEEHLPQVHGGLYVTGFDHWTFVSYNRKFPKLVIEVERDDEIQANILEAVQMFLFRFKQGWDRLCELNGGPPKRLARAAGVESADLGRRREPEYVDIIP